jgi:hypothetical protein
MTVDGARGWSTSGCRAHGADELLALRFNGELRSEELSRHDEDPPPEEDPPWKYPPRLHMALGSSPVVAGIPQWSWVAARQQSGRGSVCAA